MIGKRGCLRRVGWSLTLLCAAIVGSDEWVFEDLYGMTWPCYVKIKRGGVGDSLWVRFNDTKVL